MCFSRGYPALPILLRLAALRPPASKFVVESEDHSVELLARVLLAVGCQVFVQRSDREWSRRAVHADILAPSANDVVGLKNVSRYPVRLWRLRDIDPQLFADFSFAVVFRARPLGCPAVGGKGFSTVSATCSFWRRAMSLAVFRTRK
jgi:hypothetical protein